MLKGAFICSEYIGIMGAGAFGALMIEYGFNFFFLWSMLISLGCSIFSRIDGKFYDESEDF